MGKIKCFLVVLLISVSCCAKGEENYVSAVGDPGMKRDGLRVALEAWNFCNEVGKEAPNMGSPRIADCFDVENISNASVPALEDGKKFGALGKVSTALIKSLAILLMAGIEPDADEDDNDEFNTDAKYIISHKVNETVNKLGVGEPFPGKETSGKLNYINNVDLYAAKKEELLGGLCEVRDEQNLPWQFWMVMLKNGNMDTSSGLCPKDGHKVGPFPPESRFPCFEKGQCMNQPSVYHDYTKIDDDMLKGRFYGSWEVDADITKGTENISYFSVDWEKEVGSGGWKFHHVLKTSQKYPWLMLYLRSDTTKGLSGGYHYQTRGMTKIIPESPNFKVKLRLDITKGGGPKSQFYLMDMGSCWKNNGQPCDGDVTTDVTRYSEMIINPETEPWCRPKNLDSCPPYHTFANGTRVHRNDTRYPHSAYHMYCSPGNGKYMEEPYNICDQYSNPQPQEILQILPHPVWGEYGYPTNKGEGWVGDARSWELDVGGMSHNLYFYQDPGTAPVKRKWPSLDVGTEIYVSNVNQMAEWTVSEFDILIPKSTRGS